MDISMMKQLRSVETAPERIMEVVLGRREVRRGVMDGRKARKLNKAMHRYLHTRFELLKKLVLVRDQIEHNLGRRVDVASSCGLGRRTREAAKLNLEIAKAVALAD